MRVRNGGSMTKKLLLVSASALLLGACSFFSDKDKDRSQELVNRLGKDTVIIEYKGGKITAADVDEKVQPQFERIREQLLNAYVQAAHDLLAERMKDRLQGQEVTVSDQEVDQYMSSNRVSGDQRENIKKFLASEKKRIQKQLGTMQLMNELEVVNKLGAARYDIKATGDMAAVGSSSAKVTVQVYCDFGNPICNRTRLIMKDITSEFGEKVRWVYRHFPVASNKIGFEAARLSICAHEQGKFWEVHDKFYDQQAALNSENMAQVAVEAGANQSELQKCFNSQGSEDKLQAEIKSAEALGLTQTPAYFINGTKINNIDDIKPYIKSLIAK
jgi:protein-disulfide isomerase